MHDGADAPTLGIAWQLLLGIPSVLRNAPRLEKLAFNPPMYVAESRIQNPEPPPTADQHGLTPISCPSSSPYENSISRKTLFLLFLLPPLLSFHKTPVRSNDDAARCRAIFPARLGSRSRSAQPGRGTKPRQLLFLLRVECDPNKQGCSTFVCRRLGNIASPMWRQDSSLLSATHLSFSLLLMSSRKSSLDSPLERRPFSRLC